MCTFVDGEQYIKQYLNEIVNQTIFNEVDLYIVDAASNGKEKQIIKKFTDVHSNIFYIRLEEKITIPAAFNLVLDKTKNEFIEFEINNDNDKLN
jgi:hypothetical protein